MVLPGMTVGGIRVAGEVKRQQPPRTATHLERVPDARDGEPHPHPPSPSPAAGSLVHSSMLVRLDSATASDAALIQKHWLPVSTAAVVKGAPGWVLL